MKTSVKKTALILATMAMFAAIPARGVRPFITDDAALIGFKRIEFANWGYYSDAGLEIWHSLNNGLTDWMELTVAGVWGVDADGKLTGTMPLLQMKFLIKDYEPNGLPGFTCAVGSDLPWGSGYLQAPGYNAFGFATATQCIGMDEQLLLHFQLGATWLNNNEPDDAGLRSGAEYGVVWGVGVQTKLYKGLHLVSELVQGDPYDATAPLMYQLGIRQFVSDKLQFDCAFGGPFKKGEGRADTWLTAGIRYVIDFNKDSKYAPNGRRIVE